jgi:hypothetical protein
MEHDQKTAIIHDHFKTQTTIGRLSQLPNATFAGSMQKTFMESSLANGQSKESTRFAGTSCGYPKMMMQKGFAW